MTAAEPTRERVEAYEAALGCEIEREAVDCPHDAPCSCDQWANVCQVHDDGDLHDGCPVAVAAARVEAERVAEVEKHLDNVTSVNGWKEHEARFIRAEAEVKALRAVVERVRAAVDGLPERTEGPGRVAISMWPECDQNAYSVAIEEAQDVLRDALLPEPVDAT